MKVKEEKVKHNKVLFLLLSLILTIDLYAQTPVWENLGLVDTVITDIASDDSGNIYIVSQPLAVLKSTDNGKTWKPKINGITTANGTSIDIDSKGNIYLSAFGGVFKSTNGGENWFRIAQELTNLEFHLVKVIPNDYVFVSNFDGIFRSTNYGVTWDSTDYHYWGGYEIGINDNGIMFVGNFRASWFSIYRSINLGENWIFSSKLPANELLFSKNGKVHACVGNNPLFDSDIYKTTDDGLTWNRTNSFVTTSQISYQDFEIDRNNDFYVIVGSADYKGIYLSIDTGETWSYQGLSEYVGSLSCLSIDSNGYIYAGSLSNGIFRKSGRTIPVELVSFTSETIKNDVKLIWITATELNNYGFEIERKGKNKSWAKIDFVIGAGTSTQRNFYSYMDNDLIPDEYLYRLKQIDYSGSFNYSSELRVTLTNKYNFNLLQNYPNPFNPYTQIKYSLKEDALVTLKLYDILGNEIATLVEEAKTQGNYTIDFNADKLSSGVYIYQLKANNYIASRKMIITK